MAIWRIPVELRASFLPSPAVNVWHARTDNDSDLQDALDGSPIATLWQFYNALQGRFPSGLTVHFPPEAVEVTEQRAVSIAPQSAIAGASADKAPAGLAMVISWRTSLRARRGMGRTFIGPLTRNAIDPTTGLPEADDVNIVAAATDVLLADSQAANGWALGVYGQQNKGIAEPKVLRDFTSYVISPRFAHLSSRRD